MQDRRYRPGDVLDDYCPRERRITDHAIVAMIDDEIRQTRCGVCDAEHEYKQGKVPARRKTPPALFTQVLEGLNGPAPRPAAPDDTPPVDSADTAPVAAIAADAPPAPQETPRQPEPAATDTPAEDAAVEDEDREHFGFRRSLIRATFPRPDGQAPPPRALPDFTIQSLNNRGRNNGGQRHAGGGGAKKFGGGGGGRRRQAGGGSQDHLGPMRFRDHGAQTGGSQGQGQGQGPGQGGGRRRRGGKKNR